MSQPTDLADRYGTPSRLRRQVLLGASVVLAAAFLGWLGWTMWDHSNPEVRSSLIGYQVIDEHRATATVEVQLADDGVDATCKLRAYAEDHVVVGELMFNPQDGRNTPTMRTERLATAVELLGCTTAEQQRPR